MNNAGFVPCGLNANIMDIKRVLGHEGEDGKVSAALCVKGVGDRRERTLFLPGECEAIRDESMRIYARERMDRITVKALCAAVPVARTTFYAHYRNVDDVLSEVEDGLLAGLAEVTERVSGGELPHMDFEKFLDETLAYIKDRWAAFHALLVDQPGARFASKIANRVRYNRDWWGMVTLDEFEWNDTQGPFNKSYDLLGDESIQLVNIPGHADGLFAVKVTNQEGKCALLFSDGGYAARSWQEQITSGIAADKQKQKASLAWIREQSLDPLCVESLANHDPDVVPHVIEL